jgi:hypothetical protein
MRAEAMNEAGRWLIVGGALMIALGVYIRLGGPIPPLGRLPGDIVIRRDGMVIWIPITTMVLLSVLLTVLLRLFGRAR